VYNLNYTPTALGVQSWREITSGGTRPKEVEYHYCRICGSLDTSQPYGPLRPVTRMSVDDDNDDDDDDDDDCCFFLAVFRT
jgi:hypothetical protein